MQVLVDTVDDDGATCRTWADAPEIDGNLFIDEGFEDLAPGDLVMVEVDEASDYDLWGRIVPDRAAEHMIHITTTCDSVETARTLARAALDRRLAACANISRAS
jgi:hypothetical protein